MKQSIEQDREHNLDKWLLAGSLVILGVLLLATLFDLAEPSSSADRRIPITLIVYIAVAVAASALGFWRLFRALKRARETERNPHGSGTQLDPEVPKSELAARSLRNVRGSAPSAMMTFVSVRDADGAITDFEYVLANEEAERLTGMAPGELIGKYLLNVMPETAEDGSLQEYIKVVESGMSYMTERRTGHNGMDRWLSTHAVRMRDGFSVTFTDITEQLRAWELEQETARLALADRIARTVAHEVRNPLTNVHLGLEQLTDELVADRDVAQPFLDIINRNVKRIGQLVTEMLESSRRPELNQEPCSVKEVLKNAMARLADRLEMRDMKGEMEVADGMPDVLVDPELLNLAITNIAVNALEAMEPGKGVLHMAARSAEDGVVIELRDNGKGIHKENIPRLFEAFYSERTGGLGLGLTTARSILNAHGILLQVDSAVGQGTTFTLLLPRALIAEVEHAPVG